MIIITESAIIDNAWVPSNQWLFFQSEVWVDDETEKEKLIKSYKDALR